MAQNGKRTPPRPRIELRQSGACARTGASSEEAAAITAAIEQFLSDTAPPPPAAGPELDRWTRAGLFENAGLDPFGPSSWGDPEPWGRQ